jgi:hypothetical protein
MLRAPVRMPLVGTAAEQAPFGGDDQSGGIGVKRFRNQFFGNGWAVAVRRVDKVYAQLYRPA